MGYIVIAMPKPEDASRLGAMIRRSGMWEELMICTTGNEILHYVESRDISLIICSRRLSDMGYEDIYHYLPYPLPMLLLTKNPKLVPVSKNIRLLFMPFKAEQLISLIREILPGSYFERKKRKPKRTPEEQKIIDEAKAVLMDKKEMSEPDAFRFIQKTSMDTGRSLVESAQMVLLLNSG